MPTSLLRHGALAVAVASGLAAGCTDDAGLAPGELLPVLRTFDSVTAGHPIDVVAYNPGTGTFTYGGCAFSLERRQGDAWILAWPQPGTACAAAAVRFGPRHWRDMRLPGMLIDGDYRVAMQIEEDDSDARHVVVSGSFVIGSSGPVVLEALDDTVVSGGTARVRFRNRGSETLAFDACVDAEFESPGSRGWHSFGRNWPCVASPDSLLAGEVRVVPVPIPSWDHVRYGVRYAIHLTRPGGSRTFANTGPFWIRAP